MKPYNRLVLLVLSFPPSVYTFAVPENLGQEPLIQKHDKQDLTIGP